MFGQLSAAQSALESHLADLHRTGADSALVAECGTRVGALTALQKGVALAPVGSLAAMRPKIAASIAATAAIVEHARASTAAHGVKEAAQLAAASAAARSQVTALQSDLFERRIFDPFLRFATADDEAAYRRREADAQRYISAQLAEGTPEGDLNASGALVSRMLDAHSHGAGASHEFQARWSRLVASTETLRDAMRRDGRATEEFDRNMEAAVRQYLHDKGLTEPAITAALEQAGEPLEAVKPFIESPGDTHQLEGALRREIGTNVVPVTTVVATTEPLIGEQSSSPNLNDVMATLRAAGVAPGSENSAPSAPLHTSACRNRSTTLDCP